LNPDSSKDFELKINDLPNIQVKDYEEANLDHDPTIANHNSAIKVEGQEQEKEEETDITTSSEDDSEVQFDDDSDLDFNNNVDGDKVEGDCNMD
jgi:hypothetical protein